jgi:hypothetical protein
MGQGGIPFNRDGAIAVNMGNNKSTSYAQTAVPQMSDPFAGSESIPRPQQQAQQSSYTAEKPQDPRGALMRMSEPYSGGNTNRNKRRKLFGGLIGAGVGSAFTIDALIENEQYNRELQEKY